MVGIGGCGSKAVVVSLIRIKVEENRKEISRGNLLVLRMTSAFSSGHSPSNR